MTGVGADPDAAEPKVVAPMADVAGFRAEMSGWPSSSYCNEEPMHGYQLMQAIGDRSGGRWTPSPGAIYPAINMLEDEGLVTVAAESGRKLVTLTDAGREQAAADQESSARTRSRPSDRPSQGSTCAARSTKYAWLPARSLSSATRSQTAAAAKILTNARKELYLLLAEAPLQD